MKSKILDVEIDEKSFKMICAIAVAIILLFCLALYLEIGTLRNYKVPEGMAMDNGKKVEFHIDKVVASRKYIEIAGWAYKKGQNVGYFDSRFVIKNLETNEYKALKTQMTSIDELFSVDSQYDCRRAGMFAKSIAIDLKRGEYQILIEYKNDDENILVDTGETFKY